MNKTIKLLATASENEFLAIAIELGYKTQIEEPIIEVLTDEEHSVKEEEMGTILPIIETLEDGNKKVQVGINLIDNTNDPIEYVGERLQEVVDLKINPIINKLHTKELNEKRRKEDEVLKLKRESEDKEINKGVEAKLKKVLKVEVD